MVGATNEAELVGPSKKQVHAKQSATEKRIFARYNQSRMAALAGTVGRVVHIIAAEVPWRLLREVGTVTGGSSDDPAAALAARLDRDGTRYKRLLKDAVDAVVSLPAGSVALLYSITDDRFDPLFL